MKILVITQYFWPENFRVNDLVAELTRRGHDVTVLTGLPNYPGGEVFPDFRAAPDAFAHYSGAEVVRVGMLPRGQGGLRLMLNYLSFALSASVTGPWRLRGRKVDAIFVFEPSPITVGLPAIVLKWLKHAPIVFWVLDLWPQSLEAVGAVRSPRVLWLVDRLVRFIYFHCDRVLAQSESFMTAIGKQVRDKSRISYFPSWAEPAAPLDNVRPAPELDERPDLFTIVFTGNVGEAQDFPAILQAAEFLRAEPVRWVVVGDGRKSEWLATEVVHRGLGEQVQLVGRFPLERMPSFFRHADALLVSLRDEPIFALTIPGKLQSYLAAGIPILAMLNGEGANIIQSADAGLAVSAGDAAGLADAVRHLQAISPIERARIGENGRACVDQRFNRDTLISQLERTLAEEAGSFI